MANEIFTRLQLKYDTLANWNLVKDTFKPLAGEVCIAKIEVNDPVNKLLDPVMIKVGDGTSTWGQLDWISAKAADVYSWAKKAGIDVEVIDVEGNPAGDGHIEYPIVNFAWDSANNKLVATKGAIDTSAIEVAANGSGYEGGSLSDWMDYVLTLMWEYSYASEQAHNRLFAELFDQGKALTDKSKTLIVTNEGEYYAGHTAYSVEAVDIAITHDQVTDFDTEVKSVAAAEINRLIKASDNENDNKTIENIGNLVDYVEANADSIAQLVTDVNTANDNASAAVETANGAAETAGQALAKANDALEGATGAANSAAAAANSAASASEKAEDAQNSAHIADTRAAEASASADDANASAEAAAASEQAAGQAKLGAETAKGLAEDAKNAAVAAQGLAEGARDAAIEAKNGADAAKGLADEAKNAAITAQGEAEKAQGAAEAAQGKAVEAQGKAEAAQGAAEGFASDAGNAKTAAETAQAKAEAAQKAAEDAQAAAENANAGAIATANEAKGIAEGAAATASNAKTAADAATEAVAGLHAIATSGSIYDVAEGSKVSTGTDTNVKYLVFNCGTASTVI